MSDKDIGDQLNDLKMSIFYDIMEIVGRVFIIVRYSEDVLIGNRGFIDNERQDGITLVFNTRMNFTWQDDILEAKLVFGATAQQCVIPVQHIIAIYSPELQSQFVTSYVQPEGELKKPGVVETSPGKASESAGDNIVEVDFSRKKKK
ncbi:MAG: hypothetical protein SFH39_09435 [Candidatus Magnetobacterium sp. LHC-1]|uniref:Stringent starvation protein B n=1 Tax=Candidatus Magnetobacterium casense TaxID=1455061 RepID=A0ABS6RUS7_9BACT|nr:hypothetical protein [Candidatus Magnetobacterium casensis]MBF0606990.1 hypothetical protein [Nitrospirota bacterium]MBV6340381.1 hypothetical protein [Candidatus Magnetobacterium casensis]